MTARAIAYLIRCLRPARKGRPGAARSWPHRCSGPRWGASSAQILDTPSSPIPASGPCRSATRARNRAVFVSRRAPPPGRGRVIAPGGGAARVTARAGRGARRPGATGHSRITQARNPASVDAGARASRSSHKTRPPTAASGVASSSGARRVSSSWWRAIAHARTTPISVSRRQRVGDRRHRPDRHAPPARRGGDRVHEHTGADRGDVQHPGPDRTPPVQGQRDAQRGEH